MNNAAKKEWRGFAASVPGAGHIRYGLPCQDASAVTLGKYPAVIVCDGRGSAGLSHYGASGAVAAFERQMAILEPFLEKVLDQPEVSLEAWEKFCRILYRTLMQVKLELAAKHRCPEKEFDFTVALAVAGEMQIGCFQVGDGALVIRQDGGTWTVFVPDKGEFANQTHFLRLGGEERGDFHAALFPGCGVSGIAATSDGPEHLMFQLDTMTPGKIFDQMFDDLANGELSRQDLMDYLTRREWSSDPRGADDRSIAILALQDRAVAADPVQEDVCEPELTPEETVSAPSALAAEEEKPVPREIEVPCRISSGKAVGTLIALQVVLLIAVLMLGGWMHLQHQQLQKGLYVTAAFCAECCLRQGQPRQTPAGEEVKTSEHGADPVSTKQEPPAPDAGAIPAGSTNP